MITRLKSYLFCALLYLLPLAAVAQQASFVTMIGTNANYANGTMTANFFPPANSSQFDYLKYHFPFTVSAPLSSGGVWSLSLGDTSSVLPANSQWRLQLCSAGTFGAPTCFTVTMAVTCINNGSCSGTTLDLTSSFAGAPFPPGTGPQTAPAFIPQNTSAGPQQYFFDDFYNVANTGGGSIGTPSGNSCAASNANGSANHPGRILLTSGTAGTGTGEACFAGNGGDVNLNTAPAWLKESDVFVPVLPGTTVGAYQFGAASSTNASPWTNGIGFYLSSANAVGNDWYCEINTTYTDSTVAAVASTWTRLTLMSDGTNLHYYINGTQVCGTGTAISAITSGNMPVGAWTATALSATSITMAVDYLTAYRAVTR